MLTRILFRSPQRRHIYRNITTTSSEKPFSALPGPKGLPVVGTTFEVLRRTGKLHEFIQERHDTYGPIYREDLGLKPTVFLRDVRGVEQLVRQEGKYPERIQIEYWQQYAERKGNKKALLMSDGQRWYDMRRSIDQHLLKMQSIQSYTGDFNNVIADFIDRMMKIRAPDNEILHLDNELFNWSLESISCLLYNKRLGCLSEKRSRDTEVFIQSILEIITQTRKLMFLSPTWGRLLMPRSCKRHDEAWDQLTRVAHKTIDEGIHEIQTAEDTENKFGFLSRLLQESSLTLSDVYANITELMASALDTTSKTSMMALYELSRHPEVEDALYEEVTRIVPPDQQPGPEHLREMRYIRAVIKEVLRLHPVGNIVVRRLAQDTTLLDYRVSRGTIVWINLYGMGRMKEHYTDPDTFRPERWLRDTRTEKPHPFAWLPFGFGSRMCIGRRVAELEMYLLITQIIRKFRIEPVSMEPVTMVTELLLHPKEPVRLRFHERT